MATLLELYDLRYNEDIKKRVTSAVAIAAQAIVAESDQTANHVNRVIWANTALKDTQLAMEQIMWRVLGNATIAASGVSSTDNDIQFVVNSLIDFVATGE